MRVLSRVVFVFRSGFVGRGGEEGWGFLRSFYKKSREIGSWGLSQHEAGFIFLKAVKGSSRGKDLDGDEGCFLGRVGLGRGNRREQGARRWRACARVLGARRERI